MQVNIVVEGMTDEPVARKLLEHVGLEVGTIYGGKGKEHLLKSIHAYNSAAQFSPWFALVDLDTSTDCASHALAKWLADPALHMRFRIAIHSIEAWLMADKESMANFLAISPTKIPHNVDADSNPKQTLINITRTSRNKSIRDDIIPRQESGAKVGPLYAARLLDFTINHWRPGVAEHFSSSLHRCIKALSTLNNA